MRFIKKVQTAFVVLLILCFSSVLALWGCGDPPPKELFAVKEGKANITIVYGDKAGIGVQEAAKELVRALNMMTGVAFPLPIKVGKGQGLAFVKTEGVILLGQKVLTEEPYTVDSSKPLGEEAFVTVGKFLGKHSVVQIAGGSEAGVQYGVYTLLRQWGVRYFHPSDTYTPEKKKIVLKLGEETAGQPAMALRGFHHHTQHPIPMSVFLLEPDEKNLPSVREYLRWMVRNRQNVLQWHFLKTVDVPKWLEYVKKIKVMADHYRVKLALTISFADQQQNNYRLIDSLEMKADAQVKAIQERMAKLAEGGFHYFVVQFGTSEFTKVADDVALRWLNTAAEQARKLKMKIFAWIHTAGELKADAGGYYYHLPEKSDRSMGVYVHTTMFYDMKNPAPVYSNEDFTHQFDFLKRVNGARDVVYFPETAWWLGFDNNLPLALPITGYSRGLDILELLKPQKIQGHVTFTSGMEWGYWKYDHYLTQVTWDGKTTWDEYLQDFAKIFGERAGKVSAALQGWTKLQVRDFYKEKPEIFFYLSGELLQDELGQQAGVLARRPKRAFSEILNLKPEAFVKWEKEELAKLKSMLVDYTKLFETLPEKPIDSWPALSKKLYLELYTTLQIYVWRLQHTILLYESVRLVRKGREDKGVGADPSEANREKARKDATAKIEAAKKITKDVVEKVAQIQKEVYRYPPEILFTERKSLTSYKFGYLWETSTGFFWKRRDEQAEKLLKKSAGQLKEEWLKPPPILVYAVNKKDVVITLPNHPLMKTVIGPFIPGFLVGVSGNEITTGKVTSAWSLSIDRNDNGKPDAETASLINNGAIVEEGGKVFFTGSIKLYKLAVIDNANNELGVLGLENMKVRLELKRSSDKLEGITNGTLRCSIVLENLVVIATQVAGLERDGLLQLIGPIIGFDPKNPPRSFALEISLKAFRKL